MVASREAPVTFTSITDLAGESEGPHPRCGVTSTDEVSCGFTSWEMSHLSRYVIPLRCGQYRRRKTSFGWQISWEKPRLPDLLSRCLPEAGQG